MSKLPTYESLVADGWEHITNRLHTDADAYIDTCLLQDNSCDYCIGEPWIPTEGMTISLIAGGYVGIYRSNGRHVSVFEHEPFAPPFFLDTPPNPNPELEVMC